MVAVFAFIFIFNKQITNSLIASYQPRVTKASVKEGNQHKIKKSDYSFKKVKSLSLQTVAKAKQNTDDIAVVGEILIPADNIHLPIGKGVSNNTLSFAAGTMTPNQVMGKGNYALAGHHMETSKSILFSPLYWQAKKGQKIYLTDAQKVYEYQVTKRKFISAYDVDVINPTRKPIVTLITCDATGANRLLIQGDLVKVSSYKKMNQHILDGFTSSFNNQG